MPGASLFRDSQNSFMGLPRIAGGNGVSVNCRVSWGIREFRGVMEFPLGTFSILNYVMLQSVAANGGNHNEAAH